MRTLNDFTDEQKETFRQICSDLGGPTMTEYILGVLEDACYLSNPEFSESNYDPKFDDIYVCLEALRFAQMKRVVDSRG